VLQSMFWWSLEYAVNIEGYFSSVIKFCFISKLLLLYTSLRDKINSFSRNLGSDWTYISSNTYVFEKSFILSSVSAAFPLLPIFHRNVGQYNRFPKNIKQNKRFFKNYWSNCIPTSLLVLLKTVFRCLTVHI
jgi:hypothetical protein